MKFNFFPKESKINDFLEFPRLLFESQSDLKDLEDDLKEINSDEYIEFIKRARLQLQPYEKEIALFYPKESSDFYTFSDFMTKSNPFFGYESIESYLDFLLSMNEHQIKKSILYTLLLMQDISGETISDIENISTDSQQIMSYIKDLRIDAGAKWNLFLIIEEPVKYMNKFVDLMRQLLPLFNKIYSSYEEKIITYGRYLEDFLNKNGKKGLADKTYSIFDPDIIENETKEYLVSVINPYTLTIVTSTLPQYFIWGLNVEEIFKSIKEKKENKLNDRIQIFKNLGDKTRYEVLKLIASGEYSNKKIAAALDVSGATISYHLNALFTAKIIRMEKNNNRIEYVIDKDLLMEAMEDLKKDLEY